MRQLKISKSITNRENASLDKYLQEIGREPLITVDEEVELAQRFIACRARISPRYMAVELLNAGHDVACAACEKDVHSIYLIPCFLYQIKDRLFVSCSYAI